MLTRREALKTTLVSTAAIAVLGSAFPRSLSAADPKAIKKSDGTFILPPLEFAFDALEPHIDAQTMQIHHDKHHAAYVQNLNQALKDYPNFQKKSLDELISQPDILPEEIRTAVRNNGGGHFNHSFFWESLTPQGSKEPKDELAKAIEKEFSSFAKFQEEFAKKAMTVFGSGWAWLSLNEHKRLILETTPNQDSPFMYGNFPLLGIDIWEHAYYLKYQNRRADYVKAVWNVIKWDAVYLRFMAGTT